MEIINLYMKLYEIYHSKRKLEKRVINDGDFTHNPLLRVLKQFDFKNKKVLDIGCGTGTVCLYFASKGCNVVGIDISKKAIKLAKLNARNLGFYNKTDYFVSDFPNETVSGKYDLIICSEILEHIDDHRTALKRIYQLMKKGGHVLFSVPLDTSFLFRNNFLNVFEKNVGHLRRYNDREFIKLVKSNKFKIISITKNQGLLRDYLFTSTDRSLLVALANRFTTISKVLTFLDTKTHFLGVSNMVIIATKE